MQSNIPMSNDYNYNYSSKIKKYVGMFIIFIYLIC